MKQQNSRMVVEVNKLIANALLMDGGTYLPKIGSLSIETTTPQNGDDAPTRDIVLREKESYKSLIVIISERGNCTPKQAEQVYNRWLEIVGESDKTIIFGIGEITNGKFTTSTQMFNKLNPVQATKSQQTAAKVVAQEPTKDEPTKPTPKAKDDTPKTKKSGGNGIWLAIGCVAAVAVVAYFVISTLNSKPATPTVAEKSRVVAPLETQCKIPEVSKEEEQPATPKPAVQREPKIDTSAKPADVMTQLLQQSKGSTNKYRVVYGVFSSPSNGGSAIVKMMDQTHGKSVKYGAYPYGSETYILTIFESNSEEECQEFMRSDLGQSISKELWIHAKR